MRRHLSAPNPSGLRVVSSYACELGENPLWHTDEERLYWCDITAGTLLCFDPRTGVTEVVREGDGDPNKMIGGFTIEQDGALLLFMARGRIERWSNGDSKLVAEKAPEMLCTRFNDVIANPLGRVFCGTMSAGDVPGKLYFLDLDRTLTPVVENVGCSNGLAFTRDGGGLYYTDSNARTITCFDYDRNTGPLQGHAYLFEPIKTMESLTV